MNTENNYEERFDPMTGEPINKGAVTEESNHSGKENNVLIFAIISLVSGVIAICLTCLLPHISIILGILAVVLSIIHFMKKKSHFGVALAGLICGCVGIVFGIVSWIMIVQIDQEMNKAGRKYMYINKETVFDKDDLLF